MKAAGRRSEDEENKVNKVETVAAEGGILDSKI